ncbi:alanine--tRNA ligase, mitochondrial isoform X2 [Anoplopoma fimbria]|uniref:alanine--tRNA ligase, mitochondrial isoform X2 n=1 Tax=Anoplopoma fimbria TaxID=229290 RepID=UPI0023ED9091|nr:alanine--tRNA ligase, mitochondrial isoform X2 [Anoplopoma fimbria]
MFRLLLRRLLRPPGRLSAGSARSSGGCRPPEMSAALVRSSFLDFFRDRHGHRPVPSSPVRPRGDPSLLFVNAGMNQEEACCMAWSLLTEHYGIPADRLYVSYFAGDAASGLPADEETRLIWLEIGVPPARLLPFGLKENFWEMGDSGPCGPCTEIHYDHVGGRDAAALVNADSPEVVEIWNLVFMQYNREVDHSLRLLPRFSVDTGMGLERLVSVLQGKRSNYDTDLFTPLLHAIHQIMDIINENEAHFLSSLQQGSRLIHRTLQRKDYKHGVFPASVAWSLHRDLGFPLDLVDLMLEERGVQVDREELDRLMAENQKVTSGLQSGVRSQVMLDVLSLADLQRLGVPHTEDSLKYQYRLDQDRYVFPACRATVLALYDGQTLVSEVSEGQRCGVILDQTCFYSEQGGQSHDQGYFTRDGLQEVLYPVEAVIQAGGYVVHQITAADNLKTGDQVQLHLDQVHRLSCMVNHTATHILNFALRKVLGRSVQQRGSHVSADRLRFDFSVKRSLDISELQQVDRCVNDIISANQIVHSQELPLQEAKRIHGLRTVDEMYPDPVRVVSLAAAVSELLDDETDRDTSVELCCGTHLLQTGAIEDLLVVSERQMVKGISRIIAVTGLEAKRAREEGQVLFQEVDSLSARLTGSAPSSLDAAQRLAKEVGVLSDAVANTPIPQWQRRDLQSRLRALQRTSNTCVGKLEARQAAVKAQALLEKNGRKDLQVDCVETDSLSVLMKTVNQLSAAAPNSHVMLLAHQRHSGKILCACQVPKDSASLSASDWAAAVCRHLGGSAGGSVLVAKGTGSSGDITEALRWAEEFARQETQR